MERKSLLLFLFFAGAKISPFKMMVENEQKLFLVFFLSQSVSEFDIYADAAYYFIFRWCSSNRIFYILFLTAD